MIYNEVSIFWLNYLKISFRFKNRQIHQAVVSHSFNSSTSKKRQADLFKVETSLVCRVSFGQDWYTEKF